MRQRFTVAPGGSLRGIGLPAGQMHGIEVDNPSGQWLSIPAIDAFVPPYTLGWAQPLPNGMASIDIIATTGPASQPSTTTGDTITVYLTSDLVAASAGATSGAAFVNRDLQPTLRFAFQLSNGTVIGLQPVELANVVGRQYRIFGITCYWPTFAGVPTRPVGLIQIHTQFYGASSGLFDDFVLHANRSIDRAIYSPPRDVPLSSGLEFDITCDTPADIWAFDVAFGIL